MLLKVARVWWLKPVAHDAVQFNTWLSLLDERGPQQATTKRDRIPRR